MRSPYNIPNNVYRFSFREGKTAEAKRDLEEARPGPVSEALRLELERSVGLTGTTLVA